MCSCLLVNSETGRSWPVFLGFLEGVGRAAGDVSRGGEEGAIGETHRPSAISGQPSTRRCFSGGGGDQERKARKWRAAGQEGSRKLNHRDHGDRGKTKEKRSNERTCSRGDAEGVMEMRADSGWRAGWRKGRGEHERRKARRRGRRAGEARRAGSRTWCRTRCSAVTGLRG